MAESKLGTINLKQFFAGLGMAVIGVIITSLLELLQNGGTFNKESISHVIMGAIIAALTYISRKLMLNSDGQVLKKEQNKPDTDNP